ncbi:hypothetical protein ACFSQ7_28370 [Paenibacillus rhizoplanae]
MNRVNGQIQPQNTDEAWAKLQEKLGDEPVNPVWATWGKQETLLEEQTVKADRSDRTEPEADVVLQASQADDHAAAKPVQKYRAEVTPAYDEPHPQVGSSSGRRSDFSQQY